jgi:hypothetical protein
MSQYTVTVSKQLQDSGKPHASMTPYYTSMGLSKDFADDNPGGRASILHPVYLTEYRC